MSSTISSRTVPLLAASTSCVVAAFVVGVLFFHAGLASAQSTPPPPNVITVTTASDEATDDGDCSLREAITAANTNAAVDACASGSATNRDAIRFDVAQGATVTLGSTLPIVSGDPGLAINGTRKNITVSGNDSVRVIEVGTGGKLTLRNLTVSDGFVPGSSGASGGGLLNLGGTVQVLDSTFSGNRTRNGGGILSTGTLTVRNSTFSENSADDGNTGSADQGGGIFNSETLTVTNSTFSGNNAAGSGGGIVNNSGSTATVTNSTFTENSALQGGAIHNSDSTLTVTNSTFSGNSASVAGAGGGISHDGTTTLKNTIIANSTSGGNCQIQGTMTDSGYNIEDGTTCGFGATTSLSSTDPKLDPAGLSDNGGPTLTIKLAEDSPALDAIPEGTNGCGTDIATDQRGVARPYGEGCEIGSFEQSNPFVSRVVPQEDQTGVRPAQNIFAHFSEEMSESSIDTDTFALYNADTDTAIGAVQVRYVAHRRMAILDPDERLQAGVRYKAIVSAGALSLAGRPLDQDPSTAGEQPKEWYFTVRD